MNEAEARIADVLTTHGYWVLRNGWPDFLVMDGFGVKGFPLEVKSPGDLFHGPAILSQDQEIMHEKLEHLGLPPTYVCRGDEARLLSHCEQVFRLPVRSLTERRLAKMRRAQREADRARGDWDRWAAANPEKARAALAKEAEQAVIGLDG